MAYQAYLVVFARRRDSQAMSREGERRVLASRPWIAGRILPRAWEARD